MANSLASSKARRGSLLRLQLASLLKPHESARLVSSRGLAGLLLRSLERSPRSDTQSSKPGPKPQIHISQQDRDAKSQGPSTVGPVAKVDTSQGQLKIQLSLDAPRPAGIYAPQQTPASAKLIPSLGRRPAPVLLQRALLRPQILMVFSSLVIVLVGVLDYITGPHISLAIVYLLPVIFAAWFGGKNNGMIAAILASLVWVSADLASFPPAPDFGVALWNVSSRLGVFTFVVLLLTRIRDLQAGLEDTIAQRTRQLEVETARGVAMEREVAAVSTREQQRIAHELHDGLGQELGGLAFHAKVLAAKLAAGGVPHSSEAERLVSLLNQSISRTRALSNLLDPVGCESGGLLHALEQLTERSGRVFGIDCIFNGPATLPPLSAEAELDLYRIAQESIHNATQHGGAAEVHVQVVLAPGALTLSIKDNGCGFSPNSTPTRQDRGMGLRIMRYRASGLGARLEIESAPGHGCTVRCTLPVNNRVA